MRSLLPLAALPLAGCLFISTQDQEQRETDWAQSATFSLTEVSPTAVSTPSGSSATQSVSWACSSA